MTVEGLKLAKASANRDLLIAFYDIVSKICLYNSLHGSLMHATGCGELWMVWDTTSKLHQYGCRCTTNENDYSTKTVMGNWNEERYDIQRIVQPKPLPSQYTHCFEIPYSSDYSMGEHQRIKRFEREPIGFQATTLRWNLLRSTQLLSLATQ
ncbi:unnamed protein product [Bubo scandiacus]